MMFGITLKFMYTKEDIHAMKPPPFDDRCCIFYFLYIYCWKFFGFIVIDIALDGSWIRGRSPFAEAHFASCTIHFLNFF
jgi:hypothetical protein